jgi:hypothetical protein
VLALLEKPADRESGYAAADSGKALPFRKRVSNSSPRLHHHNLTAQIDVQGARYSEGAQKMINR